MVVLAVAVVTGAAWHRADPRLLARWGSTATTLGSRPWALLTSILMTSGPRMTAGIAVALLVALVAAERRVGSVRSVAVGVAASVVATIVCDVVLLAAAHTGVGAARAAAARPDFGASAVTAGAAGALARTLRPLLAVGVGALTLNGVVLGHTLADFEHVVAFAFGLVAP